MSLMRREAYALLCRILAPAGNDAIPETRPEDPRWPILFELADAHLVLPELHPRLIDRCLQESVPEAMLSCLVEIDRMMATRNAELLAQMKEINTAFAEADILPVWLKGAALMSEPEGQARPRLMSDIDVWVPSPRKQADALAVLASLGYETDSKAAATDWQDSHHYAPLYHPERPMRLELHRHIVRKVFGGLLPDERALARCEHATLDGLPIARLALADRVMHSLIQCSLMSTPPIERGQVKLMKLLDLARLIARGGPHHALAPELVETLRASPSPLRKPIQRFLTLFERDFLVANPLARDTRYCEIVDYYLQHDHPPPSVMMRLLLQPPTSWRQVLREPGEIGNKIVRRIRNSLGQSNPA
jgi:hypothetical protein